MNSTATDEFALFSEACGADRLHLIVGEPGGKAESRRTFTQPFFVVGRSPDADLLFDHGKVSWRHCYLQLIGGRLVAMDLGSREGIEIDGAVQRSGWIGRGKGLRLGPVELRLEADGPADEGVDPEGRDWLHPLSAQFARGLPPAALEIEGLEGQTYGWRMSRALALIGRAPSCQLRFVDPLVSSFHAALVRTPKGVWVVDLLSREGIAVDGVVVRAARLEEGSVCQVGPFSMRLRRATAAPSPPPRTVVRPRTLPAPSDVGVATTSIAVDPGGPTPVSVPACAEWVVDPAGSQAAPRSEPPGDAPQSQQVMLMLAQMLGTMHNDHMTLVRDELTEIRRLAEEMHALRVEMGRRPGDAPAQAALPSMGAAMPFEPGSLPQDGQLMPNLDSPLPRDPRECLAIASGFLAEYERKQTGYLTRMLRVIKSFTQGADPAHGPLDPAPVR